MSEAMVLGGEASEPHCRAMEMAVRQWLAIKYGFICVDDEGLAVYEIHPSRWEDGDYDFAVKWHLWYHGQTRPVYELKTFVEEAREKKIDTFALNGTFKIKNKVPWYMKLGAVVAGGFVLKWMFEGPKSLIAEEAKLPQVDTKPFEDFLGELAGNAPKPQIKYEIKMPEASEGQ